MDQITLDQFPMDQLLDQFSNGRVLLDEYSRNVPDEVEDLFQKEAELFWCDFVENAK